MQTIALGWLVLQLSHNSGFAVGLAHRAAVHPHAAVRRVGWRHRRSVRQAHGALLHPGRDGHGRGAPRGGRLSPTSSQLWMIYVIVFAFGMALAVDNPTRQSFVPELVPSVGAPQRHRAEQRDLPGGAHPRPRARRRADRRGRHGRVLRAQRGVVRVHHRRAVDDATRRAAPRRTARPREGSAARRAALRVAHARAPVDPAAHARRGDLRDQLARWCCRCSPRSRSAATPRSTAG